MFYKVYSYSQNSSVSELLLPNKNIGNMIMLKESGDLIRGIFQSPHKANFPLHAQCGEHIQPLSFRLHRQNRGLLFGGELALAVRAVVDPSLVSPVDPGIFCPGSLSDGWIFLLPPPSDSGRILLPGTLDRTLTGQSLAPHIIRCTAV